MPVKDAKSSLRILVASAQLSVALATNLVPRAHVFFAKRQDTELCNNPFQESKILGLLLSRRMRPLV